MRRDTEMTATLKYNFLELIGISKKFGDTVILRDLSLSVTKGEVVCIIGPSGCGKSTLLRIINWLTSADLGEVRLDGKLVGATPDFRPVSTQLKTATSMRAKIGMVFQQLNVWPHLNVLENVVCPQIVVAKSSRELAEQKAITALKEVGLEDKILDWPDNLSGGQKQRLAIARVLAMDPVLMLLDEPTSALDPELVSGILALLKQLSDKGMTMLVVTHELGFASRVADRIVFLESGEIIEQGSPDIVLKSPKTERLKLFLEKLNTTALKSKSNNKNFTRKADL
tara:strand:+ start:2398 stop:3246 length:849 start_codon:yes stop_codon:yes gene_type:complete